MKKTQVLLFILMMSISCCINSQTLAFPGAQGGGMYTTGGRGGAVYYVNTLEDNMDGDEDSKEGSLRWCLSQDQTRTILFKVDGTIRLNKDLRIDKGNFTLAGQSSSGDGICIADYPVTLSASNVVIRFVRFRMGDQKLTPEEASGADAIGGRHFNNVILDHCSISWCTDECASFYDCENFTLQWSIISESLRLSKHPKGPHGYGGIWGGRNSTFHHNLLAHHSSRNPRLGPSLNALPHTETVDLRNNVIYNWGDNSCYGGEAMNINIINNYYKQGPATPKGLAGHRIVAIDKDTRQKEKARYQVWGRLFVEGNVFDRDDQDSKKATEDNWKYGVLNQFSESYGTITENDIKEIKMVVPFSVSKVNTHTALAAYSKVLGTAGASLHRDVVDQRIVEETREGKATYKGSSKYNGYVPTPTDEAWMSKSIDYPKLGIVDTQDDLRPSDASKDWSAWPTLRQGKQIVDSNGDGIPDGWLEKHYPQAEATDKNESGYTYLEIYLNGLVEHIINQEI